MLLLSDAINYVRLAGIAAGNVFKSLLDAIPGFGRWLVLMFAITCVVTLLIIPIRGNLLMGALTFGSDKSKKNSRGKDSSSKKKK